TGAAAQFVELVVAEDLACCCKMSDTRADLRRAGKADGSAHLAGDRLCQVFTARLDAGQDPVQYRQPLFARTLGPAVESSASGPCGSVYILSGAHGNTGEGLFGGRVDDLMRRPPGRCHPL